MSAISFTTPDLSDSYPEAEVLPYQFLHFGTQERFAGPAATISCHEDNSCVAEAVSSPGDGRVLSSMVNSH
jgi:regulator of ribonuclease activity A